MLKQFNKPKLLMMVLLFIAISFIVYSVSQAAYWNDTDRTEQSEQGAVHDYELAEEKDASTNASVSKEDKSRTTKCSVSSNCLGCSACSGNKLGESVR